jgi:hypothetical protein
MSRQQPGSYEVVWSEQRGKDRIEVRAIPYANGGGDLRLVRVGPRGGESIIHYAGGEQSAENIRAFIRARQRWDAVFLSTLDTFYPRGGAHV